MQGALQFGKFVALRSAVGAIWAAIAVFLALASGCGRAGPIAPVVTLEGNVTIGGKPLPADALGSVVFNGTAQGQAPPVQAKLVNGHYVAQKVPKGKVLATFNIVRPTGKMLKSPSDELHPTPEQINLVPEAFRDGVSIEIQGDDLNRNFDLK